MSEGIPILSLYAHGMSRGNFALLTGTNKDSIP